MIGPLITGLMTTFRHMFKPKVAVNYPYEKVPMFPKYRGKQVLNFDARYLHVCRHHSAGDVRHAAGHDGE